MDPSALPSPDSMAAKVRLAERLRIFDFDGTLADASRAVWTVIEPDIRAVSEAY